MAIDLSRFDWTALSALGQVLAAVATIVSLWFLRGQMKLTRMQVRDSAEALKLAMEQLQEQRNQVTQARHDGVRPEFVVYSLTATSELDDNGTPHLRRGDKEVAITLQVVNTGIGPAKEVTLSEWINGGEWVKQVVPAVKPQEQVMLRTVLKRPVRTVLHVKWQDVFGKKYWKGMWVDESSSGITVIGVDPTGASDTQVTSLDWTS